jgi:hypothetical protein
MVGANGEMKRVGGTQAQRILIREPSRRAKLQPGHRQNGQTVGTQAGEHRQCVGAMNSVHLPGAQFDGESRRELRCDPIADCKLVGLLFAEPCLHAVGPRLVGQGRDKQRCIEIQRQ